MPEDQAPATLFELCIRELDEALTQGMLVEKEDYEGLRNSYNRLVKVAESIIANYRLDEGNMRFHHDGDGK